MNKKQIQIIENYKNATKTNLYQIYKNISYRKMQEYIKILDEKTALNGRNFKIISYNRYVYTCAFTFTNANGIECVKYYTKASTQTIPLTNN